MPCAAGFLIKNVPLYGYETVVGVVALFRNLEKAAAILQRDVGGLLRGDALKLGDFFRD